MNKMNKKGFTLIEMLVVIAIIAVLVSIIIPTVTSATDKAAAAANAANLRSIKAEVVTAYLTNDTSKYTFSATAVDFSKLDEDYVDWKEDCKKAADVEGYSKTAGLVGTIDGDVITLTYQGLDINDWATIAGGTAKVTEAAG